MAILYQSTSDDGHPRHDYCPTDIDTWCKYNQLALGLIDELPPKPKPTLPRYTGDIFEPVFKELSHPDILAR